MKLMMSASNANFSLRLVFKLREALPRKSAALPPDVRKAFGLPARLFSLFGLRPICWGEAPKFNVNRNGSASLPHIRRQSRWRESLVRQSLSSKWVTGD